MNFILDTGMAHVYQQYTLSLNTVDPQPRAVGLY